MDVPEKAKLTGLHGFRPHLIIRDRWHSGLDHRKISGRKDFSISGSCFFDGEIATTDC